ncbi:hypothetical protein G6O69_24035 [Pseudenhygromyxa sp. WMMC2535]|uniref:hypothetical protein n=1 Tax=Pseudenhygromyxa sp. WMMC2535 TaxID=2712867 RepID=UPI001553C4F3|nr:hypothetical protein [Pseudenhygromyxa sp. WMMC2535]NVB40931.1 hypothetical protein [Pseudenhygromyxa sp. WMMC2535]
MLLTALLLSTGLATEGGAVRGVAFEPVSAVSDEGEEGEGEAEDRPGQGSITAEVRALEAAPVRAGGRGELSLVVLERPERALPLEVRLEGGGLSLAEDRLGWAAVVDPLALQPRLSTGFRAPAEPGEYSVEARVRYSVCGERWCRSKTATLRWIVVVVEDDMM